MVPTFPDRMEENIGHAADVSSLRRSRCASTCGTSDGFAGVEPSPTGTRGPGHDLCHGYSHQTVPARVRSRVTTAMSRWRDRIRRLVDTGYVADLTGI